MIATFTGFNQDYNPVKVIAREVLYFQPEQRRPGWSEAWYRPVVVIYLAGGKEVVVTEPLETVEQRILAALHEPRLGDQEGAS